ncbi:MAG: hypothetical protein LBR60_00360 [Fibrobacter sp.]|nr:hypothetical protein [Fibrobacter sp.]
MLLSLAEAFIQTPIPPSSLKNYFRDTDGDSRMDEVQITFLGSLSPETLAEIDSLTVSWVNSIGHPILFKALSHDLQIDPASAKTLLYRLPEPVNTLQGLTSLRSAQFPFSYGKVHLYAAGGKPVEIQMQDAIPPAVLTAVLTSSETLFDTLALFFTEGISETPLSPCPLEFKPFGEKTVHELCPGSLEWLSENHARLTIHRKVSHSLHPGDSLRLLPQMFKDSLKNAAIAVTPFIAVTGTTPFLIHTVSKAEFTASAAHKSLPVFQFFVTPIDSEVPNIQEMGISLAVRGAALEKAIQNQIKSAAIDPAKIKFSISFQAFTNLGGYAAQTHFDISCTDKRFSSQGKGDCLRQAQKLFLRWNLMSAEKRAVATGIYIVKYSVAILYDGNVIFHREPPPQTWGVQHR